MKVCWNAIVRNESARIVRCMESLIEHVACAVILDTGSEDNTPALIKEFFELHRKPVEVHHSKFENFEQARNQALDCAHASQLDFDYLLLCDADMELCGRIPNLSGHAYQVVQRAGGLEYYNTRLLKRTSKARYIGVTHEYLNVPEGIGMISPNQMGFLDHADGENRKDKFQRDISLLAKALEKEPNNSRYWFYLAQSHRDAGETEAALTAYKKRVELGGWDEEVWNAQLNVAHCYNTLGDVDGFIRELLQAHEMRPQRAEAMYDLAHHFRVEGLPKLAATFAKIAQDTPRPDDVLFVNDFVYRVGADEEMSIAGYYHPRYRSQGFRACDRVAMGSHGYHGQTAQARANLFHYLPRAGEIMGTFVSQQLEIDTDGWNVLNPSIARKGRHLYCVVRSVNYVLTPEGRYDIDGKGSDISSDNPIRTRNYLVKLHKEDLSVHSSQEIIAPTSGKFDLVLGWEDMRLFDHGMDLGVSATVREANEWGQCEQWWARLALDGDAYRLIGAKRLPKMQDHEKNWMPIVGRKQWVHTLGTLIDEDGNVEEKRCPLNKANLRGSSQVIPFMDQYLCIVHEASIRPDTGQRFYWHRFVQLDADLNVINYSLPFVFQDRQIEFCAGLCWHPDEEKLVISYGVRDNSAWLATVSYYDVIRALSHETT